MNILFLSGQDIGGWGWRVSKAINKYTKWKAKNAVYHQTYLGYPIDAWIYGMDHEAIKNLLEWADFYILRWMDQDLMFGKLKLQKYLKPNNFLIKLHGSEARTGLWLYWFHPILRAFPNTMIVTSFDYTIASLAGFNCYHIPHMIHLDELPDVKRQVSEPIKIAHAPTDRNKKNTELFLKTVAKLKDAGYKVEAEIIEHMKWNKCIQLKAQCHITYDQVGYVSTFGMNAIEGWALRQPVIAEVDHWTLSIYPELEEFLIQANERTLLTQIKNLLDNQDLIEELGEKGRKFVEQYFDAKKVVKRWVNLIRFVNERG